MKLPLQSGNIDSFFYGTRLSLSKLSFKSYKNKMRVLILGASGRTGRFVLEEALKQGYEVRCLVRSVQKIQPYSENPQLSITEGTPANKEDLRAAAKGCNYILNSLNISRRSDFPWSRLRTPKTFLSEVMKHILEISQEMDLNRIVICSAWGVKETRKDIPWWFRAMIDYSNIGFAYKDHARQEDLLASQEEVNWTIIRPVGLINRLKRKEIRRSENNDPKPYLTISRKEVGIFMVEALTDVELLSKRVVISSALLK